MDQYAIMIISIHSFRATFQTLFFTAALHILLGLLTYLF